MPDPFCAGEKGEEGKEDGEVVSGVDEFEREFDGRWEWG